MVVGVTAVPLAVSLPKNRTPSPVGAPLRNIDHILVTPSLKVSNLQVLNHVISDHLPIALEIAVPEGVRLAG